MTPRLAATVPVRDSDFADEFAADLRRSLAERPRRIPSRYLYDSLGSALFDAICELPWYRITRAEMRLLATHAAGIWSAAAPLDRIIELGAGDGRKLAALLSGRPRALATPRIDLVDISATALDSAARAVAATEGTRVVTHRAAYEAGLDAAVGTGPRGRALVLFLGSNIGNFDPPAADGFLRGIARCLRPGDALLLGADLVKPESELLLAYDDPLGVTAAFNLNLLLRINRTLGADFDLAGFRHRATWNAGARRVEMHLVSRRRQTVRIPGAGLGLDLQVGETIWTESSYKYRPEDVPEMLERAGFAEARQWRDAQAGFLLSLCELRSEAS